MYFFNVTITVNQMIFYTLSAFFFYLNIKTGFMEQSHHQLLLTPFRVLWWFSTPIDSYEFSHPIREKFDFQIRGWSDKYLAYKKKNENFWKCGDLFFNVVFFYLDTPDSTMLQLL